MCGETLLRDRIRIDRRFEGPTDFGNGGYVAGRLARFIDGAAEITLKRPIPLSQPLTVDEIRGGGIRLSDGEGKIAEAVPAELDLTPPFIPSYDAAVEAADRYAGHRVHTFPRCFVCGPARDRHDGLCIFAGPLNEPEVVASPWSPHHSLANDDGFVRSEFCWAAMDCPGYFAATLEREGMVALLGRLTGKMTGRIRLGEKCVVMAWALGGEGRKHVAGSALFNSQGQICGIARATWIEITPTVRDNDGANIVAGTKRHAEVC